MINLFKQTTAPADNYLGISFTNHCGKIQQISIGMKITVSEPLETNSLVDRQGIIRKLPPGEYLVGNINFLKNEGSEIFLSNALHTEKQLDCGWISQKNFYKLELTTVSQTFEDDKSTIEFCQVQ